MSPLLLGNRTYHLRGNVFVELVGNLFVVGHGAGGGVSPLGSFASFELTVRFFGGLSVLAEVGMHASVMMLVFLLFFVGGKQVLFGSWSFRLDPSLCEEVGSQGVSEDLVSFLFWFFMFVVERFILVALFKVVLVIFFIEFDVDVAGIERVGQSFEVFVYFFGWKGFGCFIRS